MRCAAADALTHSTANDSVPCGAPRYGKFQRVVLEQPNPGVSIAAFGHQLEIASTRREAIAAELNTPPFRRIASGSAGLRRARAGSPASCRVTAGSCA